MEAFICKRTNCKRKGEPFANRYSLEKHERSCSLDLLSDICSGKRKRSGDLEHTEPKGIDEPQAPFDGTCVCGSQFRDKFNHTRHALTCPFVVPCSNELEKLTYKVLKIPSDQELNELKQSMEVLSPGQQANVCLNAGICIPGFFPVLCNSNRGLSTATWNEFGITGNTGLKTLRDIVEEVPITFEEAFLIVRPDGRKIFLPPTILTPPVSRENIHVVLNSKMEKGFITISKGKVASSPDDTDTTNPDIDILDDSDASSDEVLRLRGGSSGNFPDIPRRVIKNCNRYVHPRLWTNQEMLVKIRMRKVEFLDEFCPAVADASSENLRHEHESKCLLFLIKMTANDSFDNLAADFMISKRTARGWFLDILFAIFLTCPYIPSLYNDDDTTDEEIDSLLESIRNEQSPYVKHLVSAFRAADGRPVTLLNDDYTGLLMDGMSSNDFLKVQDMHSGLRGSKWTMFMSALVDGRGKVVAIPAGGGIGKSPRGGDCAANAQILDQELQQSSHQSFNRLLSGTRRNAVLLNTDLGFIESGNVNLGGRVTTSQRCQQLGVPHIYPFRPKDKKILSYQPLPVHRVTVVDNPEEDPTLAANSSRISTSLRQSVEQAFTMKNVYQILKGRINQAFFRPLGQALCLHYSAKHPGCDRVLDDNWYDMSLMYVIFAVACGLSNWFGAGFLRATSGPAEQTKLAQSLLTRLDLPNVLSDPDLGWGPTQQGVHYQVDPCSLPDSQHPGITSTVLNDAAGIADLGIPQVQPGEGRLLREPSGGGDFCLNRGEGLLSLERHRELRDQADDGHYASLTEYMHDAVLLPESTEVRCFIQQDMPRGWAEKSRASSAFPTWRGSCKVVSLKLPSHFKNNRLPANMHTVVLLYSEQPSAHNGFTGVMMNFFASWCTCKMGLRTNTLCAHRSGAMIVLQAPWFFQSKVTRMFRLIDIWRHPNFQPVITGGVPAGNRDRSVLTRAPPCRPRRSEDSRAAPNRRFERSFRSTQSTGSGQGRAASSSPSISSTPTSSRVPPSTPPSQPRNPPRYTSVNHPSGLGGLLNSNNCCYINAVIQMLTAVASHDDINLLNPLLVASPELLSLYETLYHICSRRRNASVPPFTAAPLRDSFNDLLRPNIPNNADRFRVGQFECSFELLQEILVHVQFGNRTFVDFPISAQCQRCNKHITQTEMHNKMLTVALAEGNMPLDITDLYTNRLNERQHFQDLVSCHCLCAASMCTQTQGCSTALRLQGHLSPTQGRILILGIDRSGIALRGQSNAKVLTQLREIDSLRGYTLTAVLCHVGRNVVRGHWVAFVKRLVSGQAVWWKLDDCTPISDLNPFLAQCSSGGPNNYSDFTINILVFEQ